MIQNVTEDPEQLELTYTPGGTGRRYNYIGQVWQFPMKLTVHLPYDLTILLLPISLR